MKSDTNIRPRWDGRAFTSFLTGVLFLIMALSGVVRYAAPRCRDANWAGWNVLGLGKDEWTDVHMLSALLFIAIAVVHLAFNWSVFASYLRVKDRRRRVPRRWREGLCACGVAGFIMLLTVGHVPPAGVLSAFSEQQQDRFADSIKSSPWRRAEETPLTRFAEKLDVSVKDLLIALNTDGPLAHAEDDLRDVALRRGTTPMALYRQLREGLGRCGERKQSCRKGD